MPAERQLSRERSLLVALLQTKPDTPESVAPPAPLPPHIKCKRKGTQANTSNLPAGLTTTSTSTTAACCDTTALQWYSYTCIGHIHADAPAAPGALIERCLFAQQLSHVKTAGKGPERTC